MFSSVELVYSFFVQQLHEFDALRFDIRGHGSTFFLRASSEEEKQQWVDAIENSKVTLFVGCLPSLSHTHAPLHTLTVSISL